MGAYVIEGTWDEIAARADELRNYPKLTLLVPDNSATVPNERMLTALRTIAERQKDQPYTSADDTDRLLREARAGGMYGYDIDE